MHAAASLIMFVPAPALFASAPLLSNMVGREPINICWPDKQLNERQKISHRWYCPAQELTTDVAGLKVENSSSSLH